MKLYILLASVLLVSACGFWGEKTSERVIPKPYNEREVLVNHGGAFDSCPPAHAEKGHC